MKACCTLQRCASWCMCIYMYGAGTTTQCAQQQADPASNRCMSAGRQASEWCAAGTTRRASASHALPSHCRSENCVQGLCACVRAFLSSAGCSSSSNGVPHARGSATTTGWWFAATLCIACAEGLAVCLLVFVCSASKGLVCNV